MSERKNSTYKDTPDSPGHYKQGKWEVIEVIEGMGFSNDFYIGNVLKYIFRHPYKGDPIGDLEKARTYINFKLKALRKEHKNWADRIKATKLMPLQCDPLLSEATKKIFNEDEEEHER